MLYRVQIGKGIEHHVFERLTSDELTLRQSKSPIRKQTEVTELTSTILVDLIKLATD